MTGVWHLDFDLDMVSGILFTHDPNFAFYLDFEGAKNIHVLYVFIWGFGGCWRFLPGVWHLDLGLDMFTGL